MRVCDSACHMTATLVLAVVLLLSGCSGEPPTTPRGTGTITGHIVPMQEGVVAYTQEDSTMAVIDAAGYFRITELPQGGYTLVVKSPGYSTRRIHNIIVVDAATVVLGDVVLSTHPAPFFATTPADGATGITLATTALTFYSDEPIDLAELTRTTVIDPPLAFTWQAGYYNDIERHSSYMLRWGYNDLKPGKTYTVTLDHSLTTMAGATLDDDLVVSFTTVGLEAGFLIDKSGLGGSMPLREFDLYLVLNGEASPDSLDAATDFEPPLAGSWRLAYHQTYLFHLEEFLRADADYTLRIRSDIALVDTLRLPAPMDTSFHTEPYRIVDVVPKDGSVVYVHTSIPMDIEFNMPVDTTTIDGSFHLTNEVGADVPGQLYWRDSHYHLLFVPSTALDAGQTYYINLAPNFEFVDGGRLTERYSSHFLAR